MDEEDEVLEFEEAEELDAGGRGADEDVEEEEGEVAGEDLLDELEEVGGGGEERVSKRARNIVHDDLQELDESGARGSADAVPQKIKGCRACMICGLVKTLDQFLDRGCDNCERYVPVRDDKDRTMQTTTSRYAGMIAMMDPSRSWVARYQRFQPNFVPACYSVSAQGTLPLEIKEILEDRGYNIIARDFVGRK